MGNSIRPSQFLDLNAEIGEQILGPLLKNPPPSNNPHAVILQLPIEILNSIFDELDVLDRCALALCAKRLSQVALTQEHLDYLLNQPPDLGALQHFFQYQLGRGWIPGDLQYCPDCGKFGSTAQGYWRMVSEKQSRELSGRVSKLWRQRRDDGWLRYWIERWCLSGYHCDDRTTRALIREDQTVLTCPRCAIQNPDCNRWRELKSQKQAIRQLSRRGV
jgi:hypothetical protein